MIVFQVMGSTRLQNLGCFLVQVMFCFWSFSTSTISLSFPVCSNAIRASVQVMPPPTVGHTEKSPDRVTFFKLLVRSSESGRVSTASRDSTCETVILLINCVNRNALGCLVMSAEMPWWFWHSRIKTRNHGYRVARLWMIQNNLAAEQMRGIILMSSELLR